MANGDGLCSLESASSQARIEGIERIAELKPRPDLKVDPNRIAVQEDTTVIDETTVADADVQSAVATEGRLDLR